MTMEKSQVQKFVEYRLVKEPVTQAYQASIMEIKFAKDVYEYAKRLYNEDIGVYESFYAIYLNSQNQTIGHVRISQGGIISTHVDIRLIGKCARFNSTMVRLKALKIVVIHAPYVFQFHYGTIKSRPPPAWPSAHVVSIPLWYD